MTWSTKKILASNVDSLSKFRSMLYLTDAVTSTKDIMFNPSENFQVLQIKISIFI